MTGRIGTEFGVRAPIVHEDISSGSRAVSARASGEGPSRRRCSSIKQDGSVGCKGTRSGQCLTLVLHDDAFDRRGGQDHALPLDGQGGQLLARCV